MILLIDKPKGWTSHDVVAKVKRILHEKRVGHAGTLDPNATGLLIVGTGADTKKLGTITKNTTKTYEAEIILGENRDTDDVDGKLTSKNDQIIPTKNKVKSVVKTFIGEIEQIPPVFSAIKLKGKKAYQLARKNINVNLTLRKITVYSIKLIKYEYPKINILTKVSPGTYIRSLGRDIGEKLGTGAYLNELRRTKVGKFSVNKAVSLQELLQKQKLKQ